MTKYAAEIEITDPIKGDPGISPTVTVGKVETLSSDQPATVKNTGTPEAAVFEFGIPKGEDGASSQGGFAIPASWSIRYVATFQEYKDAINLAKTGQVRMIYIVQSFTQTETITIDGTPNNPSFSLDIIGCNNRITLSAGIDGLVRTFPDLTTALKGVDFQLHVTNLEVKGGNSAFVVSGTYGSSFNHCRFYNNRIGVDARFALQTSITNCQFWDCTYAGINLEWDHFVGGSNSQSQPNHSVVWNCKFRSQIAAEACLRIIGTSGIYAAHNIFEGGDSQHNAAKHAIYFDDNGSTVVKDAYFGFNHFEAKFATAACYIKLKDGGARFEQDYTQYPGVLLHFESAAYAHMYVSHIPFLPGNTKFKSTGSGARWHWPEGIKFDPLLPTYWEGAVPQKQFIMGIDSNGQSPYINMNGKKVLTAT